MAETYFVISLSSLLVIFPLLLLHPILKKHVSPGKRLALWIIIALRLIIPLRLPVAELPPPPYSPPSSDSSHYVYEPPSESIVQELPLTSEAPPAPVKKADVKTIFSILYYAGAAVFFLWRIGSLVLFSARLKPSLKKLGVYEKIPVFSSEDISSPILYGFFRPKIVLPDRDYTAFEKEVILLHEYTHFKHRDIFIKLLLTFASALHFYNPFVHLMCRKAAEDMECFCDSSVVRGKPRDYLIRYSEIILKIAPKKEN